MTRRDETLSAHLLLKLCILALHAVSKKQNRRPRYCGNRKITNTISLCFLEGFPFHAFLAARLNISIVCFYIRLYALGPVINDYVR